MKLSADAEAKLRNWYGPSTWHTSHVTDMDRWYHFVSQYHTEHGDTVDEQWLRDHIVAQIVELGGTMNEELIEIIRKRISLMYNILDFLKATGR